MKHIKYISKLKLLALSSLIISFQSCKKDIDSPGEGPTYTITGRLFTNCNMQPVSNQAIDLFQEYSTGLDGNLNGGILALTTTDANGNFKFDFKDMDGFTESIRIPAGQGYTKLVENIPQNQSISNIEVFVSLTSNIQVSILVNNPHTLNDTLVITDFRNLSELKIPCPLNSGVLYTASDFMLVNKTLGGSGNDINWYFNPYNGTHYTKHFIVTKYCSDTTFVEIEIY